MTSQGLLRVSATLLALLVLFIMGCSNNSSLSQENSALTSDVVAWNTRALAAIAAENWMPPQAARGLAMMHGAMYDAINAVEKRGTAYQADLSAPSQVSTQAAAAHAAYRMLTHLFPAQVAAFDEQLAESLSSVPEGDAKSAGVELGTTVANAHIAWRTDDGSQMMGGTPYLGGSDPGQWRPTPPANMPGVFVSWRNVKPFALTAANQFRPGPPPALDSTTYAADFNEVKVLGAKTSATRTMDQSMMATFWVGMPGTIMEVGRMNLVIQQAVAAHALSHYECARLFALVNIAMADAAIAGIDCKYHYSAWRPITAIREADDDNNPGTDEDAAWESYLDAPAHPEYISTHSALTKAAATVLSSYFGSDTASITLPSFMNPAVTRQYASFSQVAEEAGLSRIYGGIHFRFSYEAGTLLGQQVGDYVYANLMQPL